MASKLPNCIQSDSSITSYQGDLLQLIQKIERIQTSIERDRNKLIIFKEYYDTHILTIRRQKNDMQYMLVKTLDHYASLSNQPMKILNQLSFLIPTILSEVFGQMTPTVDQLDLYAKWADHRYEQILVAQKMKDSQILAEYFISMGVDFDPSDLDFSRKDSDIAYALKVREAHKDLEQLIAAQKESKKLSKKQKLKLEVQKNEDDLKNKNLRSIYLTLAKLLHPDTETDADLKEKKNDVMKTVVQSYEEKDIFSLIQLEANLIREGNADAINMYKSKTELYLNNLKDQLKKLQKEQQDIRFDNRYRYVMEFIKDDIETGILKLGKIKEVEARAIYIIERHIAFISNGEKGQVKKLINDMYISYSTDQVSILNL